MAGGGADARFESNPGAVVTRTDPLALWILAVLLGGLAGAPWRGRARLFGGIVGAGLAASAAFAWLGDLPASVAAALAGAVLGAAGPAWGGGLPRQRFGYGRGGFGRGGWRGGFGAGRIGDFRGGGGGACGRW